MNSYEEGLYDRLKLLNKSQRAEIIVRLGLDDSHLPPLDNTSAAELAIEIVKLAKQKKEGLAQLEVALDKTQAFKANAGGNGGFGKAERRAPPQSGTKQFVRGLGVVIAILLVVAGVILKIFLGTPDFALHDFTRTRGSSEQVSVPIRRIPPQPEAVAQPEPPKEQPHDRKLSSDERAPRMLLQEQFSSGIPAPSPSVARTAPPESPKAPETWPEAPKATGIPRVDRIMAAGSENISPAKAATQSEAIPIRNLSLQLSNGAPCKLAEVDDSIVKIFSESDFRISENDAGFQIELGAPGSNDQVGYYSEPKCGHLFCTTFGTDIYVCEAKVKIWDNEGNKIFSGKLCAEGRPAQYGEGFRSSTSNSFADQLKNLIKACATPSRPAGCSQPRDCD